jgi:hypothetical protein
VLALLGRSEFIVLYVVRNFSSIMPVEKNAVLRFVKLTEKAFAPVRASPKAAGFDLKR